MVSVPLEMPFLKSDFHWKCCIIERNLDAGEKNFSETLLVKDSVHHYWNIDSMLCVWVLY